MRASIGGTWHIKHIRDGKTLAEFDAHNNITRRGAFDLFARLLLMGGINGIPSVPTTNLIPQSEGAQLFDFQAMGFWAPFWIEQDGDGILNNGGDYDSGRGIHRDDRVRYWLQGDRPTDLVPPKNDNREWSGDNYGVLTDKPVDEGVTQSFPWTHYNDGIPIDAPPAPPPRNVTSFEMRHTYRAGGLRRFRGIWFWMFDRAFLDPDFGQSCVTASTTLGMVEDPDNPPNMIPRILEVHNCDFVQVEYKLSYTII